MSEDLRLHAVRRRAYGETIVSTRDEYMSSENPDFIPSSPGWLRAGEFNELPDFNSIISPNIDPSRDGKVLFASPNRKLMVAHHGSSRFENMKNKEDNAPYARADIGSNTFLVHEQGAESPTEPTACPDMQIRENRRLFIRSTPSTLRLTLGHIKREKGIVAQPKFCYYLDSSKVLMLAAQRRHKGSSVNISYDENSLEKSSPHVVARLRSNFLGTEFTLYDIETQTGISSPSASPKGLLSATSSTFSNVHSEEDEGSSLKVELCSILFEPNRFGKNCPRKMTVLVPELDENGVRTSMVALQPEDSMIQRYHRGQHQGMVILESKEPRWNEVIKAYTLEFHGRVTIASVKNFQLVDPNLPHRVVVQFGRVDNDKFNLDYQSPLCALQAFAIAVASLDTKLACE